MVRLVTLETPRSPICVFCRELEKNETAADLDRMGISQENVERLYISMDYVMVMQVLKS